MKTYPDIAFVKQFEIPLALANAGRAMAQLAGSKGMVDLMKAQVTMQKALAPAMEGLLYWRTSMAPVLALADQMAPNTQSEHRLADVEGDQSASRAILRLTA